LFPPEASEGPTGAEGKMVLFIRKIIENREGMKISDGVGKILNRDSIWIEVSI
jgi:hypothetical protein